MAGRQQRLLGSMESEALLPGPDHSPSYGINIDQTATVKVPRFRGVPYVAWCSLTATLMCMVAGLNLGYTSPTLTELETGDQVQRISDGSIESSLFGALGVAGAPIGALVAWPVSQYFGRQPALMVGGVPSLIGWLLLANAHLIENSRHSFLGVLFAGRILTGFSTGWSIFCVSVYISEISSAKWKGRFGNCNQLFTVSGIMIAYILGIPWGGFHISYSTTALIVAAVILLFEVMMCFTCESPRWLYSKNKDYSTVLKRLRGNVDITREITEIREAAKQQYTILEQFLEFKTRAVLHPFILTLFLMFFQQFSGIGGIVAYSTPIFKQAGYNEHEASLITAFATGGIQVVATFISAMVVDHFGRKILLALSSVGLLISTATLGAYFFVYNNTCSGYLGPPHSNNVTCVNTMDAHCHFPCSTQHFGFVAIVSIIVFMIAFSIGWGPLVWTMMAELLPDQVRALGGSLTTFTNWSFATLMTLCFHSYTESITQQGAWWSFSVVMMFSLVFVILFLPETKKHSLKDIQDHFKRGQIISTSCR